MRLFLWSALWSAWCVLLAQAPAAAPPVHKGLDTVFAWVDYSIARTAYLTGEPVADVKERISQRLARKTFSTCFSGIGAPEQAVTCIAAHLTTGHLPFQHAVEWELNRQTYLKKKKTYKRNI